MDLSSQNGVVYKILTIFVYVRTGAYIVRVANEVLSV